ncbi:unnamed protein product [Clonostachys byssicola]|uniref:Uncharacterized protein n=1 Tax=Clonostachys byssicola TaxID=160290 RepID=A0A9N9UHJ1_9HYPO|nr:unnamed protein product [Clonostachys byssicola]
MAGVPSCIIRFICHIPTGILGSRGLVYQNDALKLGDGLFNSIPNGHQFREGLQIVGRTGLATFIWNFILFVPSVLCSETQLGLIGMVDLLLALVLIIGISKESMYLPRSYAQCANIEHWKLGEDGRNYFIELTTLDEYANAKPSDLCHELVQNWAIGIAVSHAGTRRRFENRSGLNIGQVAKPIAINASSWIFADGTAPTLWHWASTNPVVLWQSRLAIQNWSRRMYRCRALLFAHFVWTGRVKSDVTWRKSLGLWL